MNASLTNNYTKPHEFDSGSPDENRGTTIILSIVMPVLLVLFCIGYAVWDMERSTRPDKKEESQKHGRVAQPRLKNQETLKVRPVVLTAAETKETPNTFKTRETLEVKETVA